MTIYHLKRSFKVTMDCHDEIHEAIIFRLENFVSTDITRIINHLKWILMHIL